MEKKKSKLTPMQIEAKSSVLEGIKAQMEEAMAKKISGIKGSTADLSDTGSMYNSIAQELSKAVEGDEMRTQNTFGDEEMSIDQLDDKIKKLQAKKKK